MLPQHLHARNVAHGISASGSVLYWTSNLPSSTSVTVCGWACTHGDRTGQYRYFATLENTAWPTGSGSGYYLGWNSTNTFEVYGATSFGSAPATDTWFFWAFTCSGTGANTFNGYWSHPGVAFTTLSTVGTSFTPASLNLFNDTYDEWNNVALRDVLVYPRVLTANELYLQRERSTPITGDYRLWWPGDHPYRSYGPMGQPTVVGTIIGRPGPPMVRRSDRPWQLESLLAGGVTAYTLTADAGSYALTGSAAGLRAARRVTGAAGSYTLTGSAASLLAARRIVAAAGSYSLTGSAAGLTATRRITAAAGSYSLTGSAASLEWGRVLVAGAGSYSLTGSAAALAAGRRLTAAAGSYSLTGGDAGLRWSHVLTAAAGSYTLAGADAALLYSGADRVLVADAGSYSITGADAAMRAGRRLAADAGSYLITGADASLRWSHVLTAGAGSYALAGAAAGLHRGYRLTAAAGSYSLTGNDAALSRTYVLVAGTGSYAITGATATLIASAGTDLREAIVAYLGADAGVTAIIDDRIRPGRKQQNDDLPALVYTVRRNPRGHFLDEPSGIADARVLLDAMAWTKSEAIALRDAVNDALDGRLGSFGGVQVIYAAHVGEKHDVVAYKDGSDRKAYRVTSEFRIKHRVN